MILLIEFKISSKIKITFEILNLINVNLNEIKIF